MIVRSVSQTRKNICQVCFDDGSAFRIHIEVAMSAGLRPGCEISEEKLNELIEESEFCLAREYALRILASHATSKYKLKERLCERFDEDIAEAVAAQMAEVGAVNDSEYAFFLAADMLRLKNYGDSRVLRELRQKGISWEDAEDALQRVYDEFPEDVPDEPGRIRRLVEIKRLSPDDEAAQRRFINSLIRLGYDYSDIKAELSLLEE
ncbi:MAG: RecX family transcriptional regulator [Ruminococcaceae bacterium]|nr:RecX family transcriptional regulator [Oscillospiraceae bacterium]